MATFSSECAIRAKFQLKDETLVPGALVTGSLSDAHTELLRYLEPVHGTATPEEALVLGETLLAGAHLYRSLAAKEAFEQRDLTLGGQQLRSGNRMACLMRFAETTEQQAWGILEPYLRQRPSRCVAMTTDSEPLIGG